MHKWLISIFLSILCILGISFHFQSILKNKEDLQLTYYLEQMKLNDNYKISSKDLFNSQFMIESANSEKCMPNFLLSKQLIDDFIKDSRIAAKISILKLFPMTYDKNVIPFIIQALRSNDRRINQEALVSLTAMGNLAIPFIMQIIFDENEENNTRKLALISIAHIKDLPEKEGILVNCLQRKEKPLRVLAILELSRIGSENAIKDLQRMFTPDEQIINGAVNYAIMQIMRRSK